ncbi:hypothetical protein FRB94_002780 [Tulasnella sp. JGI-2019a]|nr:hypothetical protein FRB94_002780 [Tulasnella sp. JGI-2019a]KAG9012403.1 hypothetical protein FRB93_001826 [Tulasnella sp. JGI-2019a]KAG9031420.1 hypothetical protein FRB95_002784 [Tulasnella sp. JGI-2019a]
MATVNDLDPPNSAAKKTRGGAGSPIAKQATRGRGGQTGRRGRIVRDEDLEDGDARLFEGDKSPVLSGSSDKSDGSDEEDVVQEAVPAATEGAPTPGTGSKGEEKRAQDSRVPKGDAPPAQEGEKPKKKPKKKKRVAKKPEEMGADKPAPEAGVQATEKKRVPKKPEEKTAGQPVPKAGAQATAKKRAPKKPEETTAERPAPEAGAQTTEKKQEPKQPEATAEDKPTPETETQTTEKKPQDPPKAPRRQQSDKPKFNPGYVNPERINTGGMKNEKLSEAELASVMERMRLNNEQLKARRELVEADKETYETTVQIETERQKADRQARSARPKPDRQPRPARPEVDRKSEVDRKIQANIDAQRAEAAKRKLAKQDIREWDAEKGADWAKNNNRGESSRGRGGGDRGGRDDREARPGPAPSLSSLVDAALSKQEDPKAS